MTSGQVNIALVALNGILILITLYQNRKTNKNFERAQEKERENRFMDTFPFLEVIDNNIENSMLTIKNVGNTTLKDLRVYAFDDRTTSNELYIFISKVYREKVILNSDEEKIIELFEVDNDGNTYPIDIPEDTNKELTFIYTDTLNSKIYLYTFNFINENNIFYYNYYFKWIDFNDFFTSNESRNKIFNSQQQQAICNYFESSGINDPMIQDALSKLN